MQDLTKSMADIKAQLDELEGCRLKIEKLIGADNSHETPQRSAQMQRPSEMRKSRSEPDKVGKTTSTKLRMKDQIANAQKKADEHNAPRSGDGHKYEPEK